MELTISDKPALSSSELAQLATRKPWRSVVSITRVYLSIVLCVWAALHFGIVVSVLAFFFIAALQHGISILQHEAVHGLLFNNRRLNDWVGAYLLSYPIGFSLEYRQTHFAHHRHLGQEGDPDLHNYSPFPASRPEVILKIIRECSGWGAAMQFLGVGKTTSGGRSHLLAIVLTQLCLLGLFVVAGHPFAYLFLWVLPLATFAKGFAQLRNLAEHFTRTDAPVGSERIRTFQSSRAERFFLGPLNFNYHAEHHWYTNVPYYHLPALRKLLQSRSGFTDNAEFSPSYLSVLRRLIRRTPSS